MLSTVVVGLEVLTGICAGVEDADEVEGAEDVGEDDEFVKEDDEDEDANMEEDIIGGGMDEDEDADADVLAEAAAHADALMDGEDQDEDAAPAGARLSASVTLTLPHLLSLSIPARLTQLALLNPLSFPPSTPGQPSIHPPTTAVLSTVHLRALEALNNLLLTIVAALPQMPRSQASQLVGSLPLQGVWDGVMHLVQIVSAEPEVLKQRGQEMRAEVFEMGVGCAWGVAKIGAGQVVSLIQPAKIMGFS